MSLLPRDHRGAEGSGAGPLPVEPLRRKGVRHQGGRHEVKGTSHPSLLGVTFDCLLHFGQHCARVRRKVKPRLAHLRAMAGRSWGLREAQLRSVANGYIRGALDARVRCIGVAPVDVAKSRGAAGP